MPQGAVLVIENDIAIADGICEVLDLEGYTPWHTTSFDTGLQVAWDYEVDIIVFSAIPLADTERFLQALRTDARTRHVLLLALLPRDTATDVFWTLQRYYPVRTLTKPFSVQDLLATLVSLYRGGP